MHTVLFPPLPDPLSLVAGPARLVRLQNFNTDTRCSSAHACVCALRTPVYFEVVGRTGAAVCSLSRVCCGVVERRNADRVCVVCPMGTPCTGTGCHLGPSLRIPGAGGRGAWALPTSRIVRQRDRTSTVSITAARAPNSTLRHFLDDVPRTFWLWTYHHIHLTTNCNSVVVRRGVGHSPPPPPQRNSALPPPPAPAPPTPAPPAPQRAVSCSHEQGKKHSTHTHQAALFCSPSSPLLPLTAALK